MKTRRISGTVVGTALIVGAFASADPVRAEPASYTITPEGAIAARLPPSAGPGAIVPAFTSELRDVRADEPATTTIPPTVQPPSRAEHPAFFALVNRTRVGDRLTITRNDGSKVKGELIAFTQDAITLKVKGAPRAVPLEGTAKITRTRRGVILGTIIGGAIGAAFGAALHSWAVNEGGSVGMAWAFPLSIGIIAGLGADYVLNVPRTVYGREPAR